MKEHAATAVDYWHQVTTFARSTSEQVGTELMSAFGTATAEQKADGSLVTKYDKWADQEFRDRIDKAFPDHGVLTEEAEHTFPATDWCWVIDPIDGTTNFARGVPLWGISLGLLYRGTPVFGHVYIPPIDQHFHGFFAGNSGLDMPNGAFANDEAICIGADCPSAVPSNTRLFSLCARSLKVLQNPFPCKIRMLGVATYNLLTVASGVCLGAVEATPKIWDIAAVWAITQAAGASWIDLNGEAAFPLEVGKDYSTHPFPTLVTRPDLIEKFKPLVKVIL
ncbi:Inositol monophosphatase family [Synechococcus sp. PCC 7335]|uniref:inositol monophosphatase family protein n=1 Tax=Synechococcus sp. (strain ATCC 29403 / PCC 7335) TaxID=91464 RepID=UPI00017EB7EA|nr:inositol monophosphatase family protein [Synechococcus sp. PCC 7335]EDX84696.1 Inositol monophosphatase family [Synechococcus sp. PCC 7335]